MAIYNITVLRPSYAVPNPVNKVLPAGNYTFSFPASAMDESPEMAKAITSGAIHVSVAEDDAIPDEVKVAPASLLPAAAASNKKVYGVQLTNLIGETAFNAVYDFYAPNSAVPLMVDIDETGLWHLTIKLMFATKDQPLDFGDEGWYTNAITIYALILNGLTFDDTAGGSGLFGYVSGYYGDGSSAPLQSVAIPARLYSFPDYPQQIYGSPPVNTGSTHSVSFEFFLPVSAPGTFKVLPQNFEYFGALYANSYVCAERIGDLPVVIS